MSENFENKTELDDLKNQLQDSGIDISQYGKGKAKRVEDLLKEIKEGETILEKDENGVLLRKIGVSTVEISYTTASGEKLKLKEEKQVFNDGRERIRNLPGSVFGKIKKGEDPELSMAREIEEELGIAGVKIQKGEVIIEEIESPSYPGLISQYTRHAFTLDLETKDFKPEGYIEKGDNLTTLFVWEKV